jgi:hypothetical protein
MMVLSALRPDASLPEFLAHRARSASIWRLTIDAVMGAGVCAATVWWRPTASLVLATASLCFLSYGVWGMLDRARSRTAIADMSLLRGLLDAMCAMCALLGAFAAAGMLLGVWAMALGTWIS